MVLSTVDVSRHKAGSGSAFTPHSRVISEGIEQYDLQLKNVYNVNKRSSWFDYLMKSKRMFAEPLCRSEKLLGAVQDGSRKWVIVVVTVCADAASLSPSLIYEGQLCTFQGTWLESAREE